MKNIALILFLLLFTQVAESLANNDPPGKAGIITTVSLMSDGNSIVENIQFTQEGHLALILQAEQESRILVRDDEGELLVSRRIAPEGSSMAIRIPMNRYPTGRYRVNVEQEQQAQVFALEIIDQE